MNATRTLDAGGGVHLATERWVPSREVRAHVVFVHGLGEHRRARPYVPLYEKLATSGYAVLAFDLRGHGASDGPRLYARDFAVLEQDVARAVEVAADDAQGRPVFVIGGSLGGLPAVGLRGLGRGLGLGLGLVTGARHRSGHGEDARHQKRREAAGVESSSHRGVGSVKGDREAAVALAGRRFSSS